MWFVFLGIGIAVVVIGGLYFRRRFVDALRVAGASERVQRISRWGIPYLLFGYLIFTFARVGISIALGRESLSIGPGGIWTWLLVYPFWLSILVVVQSLPFIILSDIVLLIVKRHLRQAQRQKYSAIICLLVVAFFAVYTPARIVISRSTLHVHRYDIGDGKEGPFRIVFVADLQRDEHTDGDRTNQVVELVNQEKADVILFGGDWISSGNEYINKAAAAGGRFRSRLGTFSVRGDHEHFAYRDADRSVHEMTAALEKEQVQMPHNEVRWFDHNGKRIGVAFLSNNYVAHSSEEDLRRLLDEVLGADYSILMTHQFNADLAEIVEGRVDLVLAAHTHGGQINPVVGFVHAPLARLETPFVEGRYRLGARTTIIVTAGIGYSVAPFRYASPASFEVVALYL